MFNILHLKNILTNKSLINKLKCFYRPLSKNSNFSVFCKSYHTSFNHACKIKSTRKSNEEVKLDIWNPNTNVQNNVLLFKFVDNTKFILFKLFSYGWIFIIAVLLYYLYDPKFMLYRSKEISWTNYKKQYGLHLFIFVSTLLVGSLMISALHVIFKRYIKYIILHKGGKEVTIITYHLFKSEQIFKFPVSMVTSVSSRSERKLYIPVKIKGHIFYFIVDGMGTFVNGSLFDNTIGVRKVWK